ncbi:unnamed protein product, partial [Vitis vinifera]
MAEIAVTVVTDRLLSLLDDEARLLRGVKTWVQELRETAYCIEDLVDEYILHFANPPHRSGSCSGTSVPWHDPGVTSLFIEDAEIVGIESHKGELIKWLVEGAPERTVISVVGMGGLGKTTLAKKVYDNKRMVEHFDCRAWITVSQSFKMEEVLRNVIKQFYLARKEYVVVFDDVWKLDSWELFCKKAFQGCFCPPELEEISLAIVKRCEGLPLAISCFVYFAIFPEDYSINCGRLIRLWIAEGFVKGKKGITLEQVAEEYLTELIHRSLVQLSYVDYRGKIRSCRVHDLMREIILRKAEELSLCRTFLANFKLLKVLDFEKAPLYSVPEDLGNLFHLRYLSLRRTKVKMLPKSIGKLQNLQTLDLKHSLVDALPVEIKKLQKLRHILAYSYNYHSAYQLPSVRGILLKQLRKLGITNLMEEDGLSLYASISNMKYLRTLFLQGCLSKLPEWLLTLRSLVRVCLRRSRLSYDPVEVLQALPNLLEVELHTAYDGECLCFSELGFQKLERLQLRDMKGLKTLKIRDGALPLLKHFEIGPSPQLEEVPPGIRLLKTLTSIEFWGMSEEFAFSMVPDHGQNYHIVEHVPNVFFHFFRSGGYSTKTLR